MRPTHRRSHTAAVVVLLASFTSLGSWGSTEAHAEAPTVAPATDAIANALVLRMYERRAASQRRQGLIGQVVGGTLIAGGMLAWLAVRSSSTHTQALVGPFVIEGDLLGLCLLLAGSAGGLPEAAAHLDSNGTTSRAALIADDRKATVAGPRVLAIGLVTALSVMAIGAGVIAIGQYGTLPTEDKTGWFTSGAAIASLGAVVGVLGIIAFDGMRRQRARLDAGIVDDLDSTPPRVTLAPMGLRGGGGLALAGSF